MIVLTIVIYHYPSIVMCENLTIAHLYLKVCQNSREEKNVACMPLQMLQVLQRENPLKLSYDEALMREHLLHCFSNRNLELFP